MKKIFILFALIIFMGCSKSDKGVPEKKQQDSTKKETFEGKQQDLAGTWIISKEVFEDIDKTVTLSDCDKRENIVVDSEGNAVWEQYLDKEERCESFSIKLTFTAESSIYFDIEKEDLLPYFHYTGKFKGKNTIEIKTTLSVKDKPKIHVVYQFNRR